jgi:hypothetical protein
MKRSPKSIYQRFVNFEEQAAAIYLRMASRFCPENQEFSYLWLEMGMQEKQHAGLLEFCVAEELFAPELPSDIEIERIESLFAKLRRRAAEPDLSIEDAFQIAAELETSEVNALYFALTTPLHNSTYLLRRKIESSLPDHVERLLREGHKYGIADATLRTLETASHDCARAKP